jgi:hypothetical protein
MNSRNVQYRQHGTWFHHDQHTRDVRCKPKDAISKPLIEGLKIANPQEFHALLMPALFGPEVEILLRKGVPTGNIWCVENVPFVHRRLLERGFRLTPKPQKLALALDFIEASASAKFDLIYIDLYGVPDLSLHQALKKILHLRMLKDDSLLMITVGKGRCQRLYSVLNREIERHTGLFLPTRIFIERLVVGHYPLPAISEKRYFSSEGGNKKISFLTTIARFQTETS